MAETRYTRLGCGLFHWEPWVNLDMTSRVLWLGLYASGEVKRSVPGLWVGGIGALADAVRMQSDQVLAALNQLIESRVAEYDQTHRIVRLTMFPDAGERAHNVPSLMGWWGRFVTIPACRVRDSHVAVLQWLVESEKSGHSEAMKEAWGRTFGSVQIPSGVYRPQGLFDSDTGTAVQPSLFGAESAFRTKSTTLDPPVMDGGMDGFIHAPSTGLGSGLGSGLGLGSGSDPKTAAPVDQAQGATLQLVPLPADVPFTVAELLQACSRVTGGWVPDREQSARLGQDIAAIAKADRDLLDLELLREWMDPKRLTVRDGIGLLSHGHLVNAFSQARQWKQDLTEHERVAQAKSQALRELREKTGL